MCTNCGEQPAAFRKRVCVWCRVGPRKPVKSRKGEKREWVVPEPRPETAEDKRLYEAWARLWPYLQKPG